MAHGLSLKTPDHEVAIASWAGLGIQGTPGPRDREPWDPRSTSSGLDQAMHGLSRPGLDHEAGATHQ